MVDCQHHLLLTPPPGMPPAPPVQLSVPPAQHIPAWLFQPAYIPQLNWSHFKPEFAGKPDEDAEAHHLRTNDWVDTDAFTGGVKVQHFFLTLVGEPRLWYKSFRPINVDRNGLQNQFRQPYSKVGNTRVTFPCMVIISFQ